jgi:hypothetical protein
MNMPTGAGMLERSCWNTNSIGILWNKVKGFAKQAEGIVISS